MKLHIDGKLVPLDSLDPTTIIDILKALTRSAANKGMEITCDAIQDAIETAEEERRVISGPIVSQMGVPLGARVH